MEENGADVDQGSLPNQKKHNTLDNNRNSNRIKIRKSREKKTHQNTKLKIQVGNDQELYVFVGN